MRHMTMDQLLGPFKASSVTRGRGAGISIITGLLRRKCEDCLMLAIYFFVIPGSLDGQALGSVNPRLS